jgi:predicted  nucleic acid-binding Zn-ribbon protein
MRLKSLKVRVPESYLSKVEDSMAKGEINEGVYNDLKRKYQSELQSINERLERLNNEAMALKTTLQSEIERFEAERSVASASLNDLMDLYSKALMPEGDYKNQKKEMDAKLKEIEREIGKRKKTLEYLSFIQEVK